MLITKNWYLEVVTRLHMVLVILKHLMIYLETFILKKITIDDAEMKQDKFNAELNALSGYTPKGKKYIEGRKTF